MTRLALAPLLLVLLVLAPATAQFGGPLDRIAVTDELHCEVSLPLTDEARPGASVPFLLEFKNTGPDRAIRTVLECNGSVSVVTSVRGGGETRRWMHVPVVGDMIFGVTLTFYDDETGRLLKRQEWPGMRLSGSYGVPGRGGQEVVVLVLSTGPSPTVSSNLCGSAGLQVFNAGPDSVPDAWVGLSAVDLLIVTHNAWTSPRMDLGPVLDWVAMGGVCLVVDAPPEGRDAIFRTVSEGLPLAEREGDTVSAGMGQIMLVTDRTLLQSRLFTGRPGVGGGYSFSGSGRGALRPALDVVQKPPFVPVLCFLVIFSLLVGPVGWWYLVSKRGRPLMYYALAPVLSVCVIVVVIVTDLVKQGVRPRAACTAIELFDQRVKKRITLSQFGIYAPFTLGRTLRGEPGELPHFLSVGRDDSPYGAMPFGLAGINLTSTPDGVFYADALPARQKAWYATQSIGLERKRLEVWKEGGRIYAENHLGVPLRDLVVSCDGEYAVFERLDEGQKADAAPVEPGVAMQRARSAAGTVVLAGRDIVTAKARGMLRRWQRAFESGQNGYMALRDGKFEELIWLDSARFSDSISVIRGLY